MPKANRAGKSRKTAASVAAGLKGTTTDKIHAPKLDKIHVPKLDERAPENSEKQETTKSDVTHAEETSLSRGQRKRQAKREQYLKKEKMVMSTLKLKKQEEQKKRIDGLDALKEALMDTMKEPAKETEKDKEKSEVIIKSNRAKQRAVASELNHMSLVLQHPAFQSNPFEAMQEHLRNKLAKSGKKQEEESKKRITEEKKAAEKRKQEKKERRKGKKQRSKFKATRSRTK